MKLSLNKGYFTLIDSEDYDKLKGITWYVIKHGNNYYARTTYRVNNKYKTMTLHRYLLNVTDPTICIDHINGDGLDNRKENLRLCSNAENIRNRKKIKIGKTKYKGVSYNKEEENWTARIYHQGKRKTLGRFKTDILAAKAYDEEAVKLFKEFANLNFPKNVD